MTESTWLPSTWVHERTDETGGIFTFQPPDSLPLLRMRLPTENYKIEDGVVHILLGSRLEWIDGPNCPVSRSV